jgi:hypothetical protein
MATTGKEDGDREAGLEAVIGKISDEVWKPGQTLPEPAPSGCAEPPTVEATGMTKGLEMRKLLALMVLFCGTASADAAETRMWCSEGAQLLPSQEDDGWILKVDGKPDERLANLHDINAADLILYDEGTEQRQNDLLYTRGRIFRPCEIKSAQNKGSDREAKLEAAIEKMRAETSKLEAAIEKIRAETSKPKQTLPKLRRAIALILQDLKR